MTLITTGMVLALLIPIALLCRQCNAWERLAAFGNIGTKVAMLALVAVMRGDRMLALVGALMISAGDAGMLLLARLLEEQKQ